MKRSVVVRTAFHIGVVFLLASAGACKKDPGQTLNDVVTVHVTSDPSSGLHPVYSAAPNKTMYLDLMFQGLMTFDPAAGKQIPQLAEGPPDVSADGLSYTFRIHPKAMWPDSAAITASDVVFSYKIICSPLSGDPARHDLAQYIRDIQTYPDDPRRVTFHMKSYFFRNEQIGYFTYILDPRRYDPERVLEQFTVPALLNEDSLSNTPALVQWSASFAGQTYSHDVAGLQGGSGPYQMNEWVPGQKVVLARSEDYWARGMSEPMHSQYPEKIVFQVVKDENDTEIRLGKQEIDVAMFLTSEGFERLKTDSSLKAHYRFEQKNRDSFLSILLNLRPDGSVHKKIFTDRRVREALALAIPVSSLTEEHIGKGFTYAASPVSALNPDYNRSLKPYEYNPKRAHDLLEEAGWRDTDGDLWLDKIIDGERVKLSFTLFYPRGQKPIEAFVEGLSQSLARVGVECVLKAEDQQIYRKNLEDQDFDAALFAFSAPPLPYDFTPLFSSASWPDGMNYMGFRNEEADSLIEISRETQSAQRRKAMVDRVQEILYSELPCIYLYYPTRKIVVHKRFTKGAELYDIFPHMYLNDLQGEPVGGE